MASKLFVTAKKSRHPIGCLLFFCSEKVKVDSNHRSKDLGLVLRVCFVKSALFVKLLLFSVSKWYNDYGKLVSIVAEKKGKIYVSDNAQLMAEWNWEKNNKLGLYPNELTCGSTKKVWWQCAKEHEWESAIKERSKTNGTKSY